MQEEFNLTQDCALCPALVNCRTNIVPPTPMQPGGILCIGEAPGATEDEHAQGFLGQAGKTLDKEMAALSMRRGVHYGVANLARCRPPNNRAPTKKEITNCLPLLIRSITELRPRVLLLVGSVPSAVFLGAGALGQRIKQSRENQYSANVELAHPLLRSFLLDSHEGALSIVPCVHTSGLSWNRKAPDGRKWSDIGREQIRDAVSLCGF